MYKNIKPVDRRDNLKYTANVGYHYAAAENFCPVFLQEMPEVTREYFICFPNNETDMPHALLGFEKNRNMYVTDAGVWQAEYIPAYMRRYPFVLAATEGGANQAGDLTVAADMNAIHFKPSDGKPLFAEGNKPTELFKNIVELLKALEKQRVLTQKAVKEIEAAGLLKMEQMTVKKKDKKVATIGGVRMIDDKSLASCGLQAGPALQLVYAHLFSRVSLRFGILSGKKKYIPDDADIKGRSPVPDIEMLFGDDDMFKF